MSAREFPPVHPLHASGARCWVGGSPPPSPPLRLLALGAGCRSGGRLVAVRPVLGPCAPSARCGTPSGSSGPPRGGFPQWASRGSPSAPLLHAMDARCWVGVLPLPSPSFRPLVLGARDRSEGPFSSIAPSALSVSARALLGVSSPPSSLCEFPLSGASPALTVTPTNVAGAVPMVCAVVCPTHLLLSSSFRAGPVVTGPPTTAAVPAPVGCAFGRPAPPARFSVSVSASASSISVASLGATPSLPSVGCSLVGQAVGGFSSPPPARVRPPPVGIRALWGLPGFRLPRGLQPLWGSSHPLTTRLPLRLCLESIHPAMTRLPFPLHWGSSRPGTTRPPVLSVAGRVVWRRFDPPPPHSMAAPPRFFLHSRGLAAPLLPFHSVGIGVFLQQYPLCTLPWKGSTFFITWIVL